MRTMVPASDHTPGESSVGDLEPGTYVVRTNMLTLLTGYRILQIGPTDSTEYEHRLFLRRSVLQSVDGICTCKA
jgi:hypothetical protein